MYRAPWNGAVLAESDNTVVAFWKGVTIEPVEAI